METADNNRGLIDIGAFDVIGRKQHDAGVPAFAVDTHIHAPLVHDRVPDDIRRPKVA